MVHNSHKIGLLLEETSFQVPDGEPCSAVVVFSRFYWHPLVEFPTIFMPKEQNGYKVTKTLINSSILSFMFSCQLRFQNPSKKIPKKSSKYFNTITAEINVTFLFLILTLHYIVYQVCMSVFTSCAMYGSVQFFSSHHFQFVSDTI